MTYGRAELVTIPAGGLRHDVTDATWSEPLRVTQAARVGCVTGRGRCA